MQVDAINQQNTKFTRHVTKVSKCTDETLLHRQSLVLELQTTRNLLVSSLNKVQELEVESKKVPTLEDRIRDLEKTLSAASNPPRSSPASPSATSSAAAKR